MSAYGSEVDKTLKDIVNSLSAAGRLLQRLTANTTPLLGHGLTFDATLPSDLAASKAAGTSEFASHVDHVHRFPTSLMEYTHSDRLTLTSDGADLTLTPSRALSDVIFNTQAGLPMLRLHSEWVEGFTTAGAVVTGHALIGRGAPFPYDPDPLPTSILRLYDSCSLQILESADPVYGLAIGTGLDIVINVDAPMGGQTCTAVSAVLNYFTPFDPDHFGGDGWASTVGLFRAHGSVGVTLGGYGEFSAITAELDILLTAPSPAWANVTGLDIGGPFPDRGSGLDISGQVPLRSYGILVRTPGNGTTNWAGVFNGDVQVTDTNKLIFGGTYTAPGFADGSVAKGINSIARGATTTNLIVQLNSANEYDIRANSLAPVASATAKSLGLITTQGWASMFLADAGTKTLKLLAANSGSAGDWTLTLDVAGGNRTLSFGAGGALLTDRLTSAGATVGTTLALTSTATIATLTCSVATLRLATVTAFEPTTTNVQTWGSNIRRPLKIFAGSGGIDSTGVITLGAAATITGSVIPTLDNTSYCGDATHRWFGLFSTQIFLADVTAPAYNVSLVSVSAGAGFTADRELSLILDDSNRTLTLTGNATLNQDVSTAGSPEFVDLNLNDTASAFRTTLRSTSSTALTADRVLTLDVVNAARTLKLSGNATLDQDVSTIADASFNTLKLADSLKLLDIGTAKYLVLKSNSTADMTADRTLTVDMANQSWTVTFNGSPTLGDWFNQDEKTTASPTHVGMTLTGDLSVQGNTTIGNASSDTLRINAGSAAGAPSTTAGTAIANYYGSSATNFLGDPSKWLIITASDGVQYTIPLYPAA
jgi:hypothetical protein